MTDDPQTTVTASDNALSGGNGQIWNWCLDWLLPLPTVAVLLISCLIISPKKELWVDEGYSLRLVADPSAVHMFRALTNGVDGAMPLYYLIAHSWALVFGFSLLSLRALSSIFICSGVLVLWYGMRRFYSAPAVALGILSATLTSRLLLFQNVELRFYGLYFACAALVIVLQSAIATASAPSRRLVAGAILANAALVMSHLFGALYSGAALLALLLFDYRSQGLRWRLYLKLASSWLLLLLWLPPILKIHDLGQPHNWVPIPDLADVIGSFSFSSTYVVFAVLFAVGIAVLAPALADTVLKRQSNAMAYFGLAVLLVPLAVGLVCIAGVSLFLDRYFLPSLIGSSILIAHLLDELLCRRRLNTVATVAWVLLSAVLLAWPVEFAIRLRPDQTFGSLDRSLPTGAPVIVEDANLFVPLTYYAERRGTSPYYYALDWGAALRAESPHATVQAKLMRNSKASGYFAGRILDSKDAFCDFDRFVVLHSNAYGWFSDSIWKDPAFDVQKLDGIVTRDPELSGWMVTRRSPSEACSSR